MGKEVANYPRDGVDDVWGHRRPCRERLDGDRAPVPVELDVGEYPTVVTVTKEQMAHSRWSPMRFTGNRITDFHFNKVDNLI